jgi:peptidoglycan-N-acetylglucosamine deacetylase
MITIPTPPPVASTRPAMIPRRVGEGLALTFDDGPDPRGTPAVLEALDRAGSVATFFVIAPAAEEHPALLRRIERSGHRIGLHCDRHIRHTEMDDASIRADTERALERLAGLGVRPALWRVPWGVRTDATTRVAEEFGLTLVGWDVDTHDWRGDDAVDMFLGAKSQLISHAVVLAHDGIGPGAKRTDCAQTATFVTLAADHAARSGLTLNAL